ncbi:hypothetical protein VTK26DRAFT_6044 [Humicola hyalothermophila]
MDLLDTLKPGTDPDRPINIVFVGAGAVGCFYASRLHHPTHNIHVSLIARSNYRALLTSGVHLETHSFGTYTFRPAAVFPDIASAALPPPVGGTITTTTNTNTNNAAARRAWDYVIVTTKALPDRNHGDEDDAALIAPLVSADHGTTIVLIQNGVGVEHPYRARFPRSPIVSAVTVVSAEQVRMGVVRQNRWTRVSMGAYGDSAAFDDGGSGSSNSRKGERGAGGEADRDRVRGRAHGGSSSSSSSSTMVDMAALVDAGTHRARLLADWWGRLGGIRDAEVLSEMALQRVRWHKLCINAAFNPSAVLAGGRGNADMVLDPELREHLRGVMEEIWAAAPRILGGKGFEADGDWKEMARPERILKSSERNKGAKPSMLVDWESGRPMELEVILGNPIRIARAKGVELPRVQTLYALLRSAQMMREKVKGKL